MTTIKVNLPKELKECEIHVFADLHMGDAQCDYRLIKERVDYVAKTQNAFAILNGDLMNNATKTSISDSYAELLTPMQQLTKVMDVLTPIKGKVLAINDGNHERRTHNKEGINLTELIARELGVSDRYSAGASFLFLHVGEDSEYKSRGRQIQYRLFSNHGSGGGRKEGAKAIRLADMASIVDADVYVHSHTHLPMVMKEGFYRPSDSNASVRYCTRLFVNTAATLNYGGYGEQGEFKPNSTDTPVIYLSGVEKRADARL